MAEIRISVPPAVLEHILALAEEVSIIERGLAKALTTVERTRFQTPTELVNYLAHKLDKHFYLNISQRMNFQKATLSTIVESTKSSTETHVTSWNTVLMQFKANMERLPQLKDNLKELLGLLSGILATHLDQLKITNDNLIRDEKDAYKLINERIIGIENTILQLVKPVGDLGCSISATKDELDHLKYQQSVRTQVKEEKMASLHSFLDTSGFRAMVPKELSKSAEVAVLETANKILTEYMVKGDNSVQDQLQSLHATVSAQLSTLRDWENRLDVMPSTLKNEFYLDVKKPMEREIATMKSAIVAEQNKLVKSLQTLRKNLQDAFYEHKRGVGLIHDVKEEMNALKTRWQEDIAVFKKMCMLNNVECLRRTYEEEISEETKKRAFELCAEATNMLSSTEESIRVWTSLMEQRVKTEDAKMAEMEATLNKLMNELVQTTHARALGIDELNRRLSHKTFELMQFLDTRIDEALFNQKLIGKVSKSSTDIAFGVYCPAEHNEQVSPPPHIAKARSRSLHASPTTGASRDKDKKELTVINDLKLLQEYKNRCTANKDNFSFIKYFVDAILAERHQTADESVPTGGVQSIELSAESVSNAVSMGAFVADSIDTHLLQVAPSMVQQQVLNEKALKEVSQKCVESPRPRSVPSALTDEDKHRIKLRPGVESSAPIQNSTTRFSLSNIYVAGSAESSPNTPPSVARKPIRSRSFYGGVKGSSSLHTAHNIRKASEEMDKMTISLVETEKKLAEINSKRATNAELVGIRPVNRLRSESEGSSLKHSSSNVALVSSVQTAVRSKSTKAEPSGYRTYTRTSTPYLRTEAEETVLQANNDINAGVLEYSRSTTKDAYRSRECPNAINPKTDLTENVSPFEYRQPRSQTKTQVKDTVLLEMNENFAVIGLTLGQDSNRQRQKLSSRRMQNARAVQGEQFFLKNENDEVVVAAQDNGEADTTKRRNSEAKSDTKSEITGATAGTSAKNTKPKPARPSSASAIIKGKSTSSSNPLLSGEPDPLATYLVMGTPCKDDLPKVLSNLPSRSAQQQMQGNKKPPGRAWENKALWDTYRAKSSDLTRRTNTEETKRILQAADKVMQSDAPPGFETKK